ncbi:MAG: sporulation protein YtfJ [Oscillospiraceae bacterium]|nr:sporulation protein YtfJ [Oscillospiraceae bacterium]
MSEHAVNGFIGVSVEKIRSMVDTDTMIGNPISCGEGITVIPISKISVGFASGGSDLPTRTNKEYFAGGAGAGMSVKPVGFLVVNHGEVRMVQMSEKGGDSASAIMDKIPELLDKVGSMLSKDKKEKVKVRKTEKSETPEEAETPETDS